MSRTVPKPFRQSLNSFFTSGLSGRVESELLDRIVLLNLNLVLGFILLSVYGTVSILQGHFTLGYLDYGIALLLIGVMVLMRVTKSFTLPSYVGTLCMGFLFCTLTITGGDANTGILWSYTFPLFISFLLGYKRGIAASLLYLIFLLIVFSVPIPAVYPEGFKIRFLGSFVCVAILSFFYEYVRTSTYRRKQERTSALEKTLIDLNRTQQALASSEQRLRDVLLSSSDWIWETDLNGRFTYASGRCADVLGFTASELIGKEMVDIIPVTERNAVSERLQKTLTDRTPLTDLAVGNLNRDGRRIWVLMNAVVATDLSGNVAGLRGVTKDISTQKHAEEDRAKLEEQFRTAQKMEAVGQLAGGIAHDFNNILGAISGYAEMIRTRFGATDVKLKKYADTILSASSRAADLTAKLLAFARRGKFQNVPFNVHHTLDEVAMLLAHSVDKRIEILTEHHSSNPVIQGDPVQIQNALMNLAINGCDAMSSGGKLIFDSVNVVLDKTFIDAHRYDIAPGEYVLISVTDTGAGMGPETKAKLFQPFFTTKDIGQGTGLGLASVYGTVKSHAGYINVYSEVGHGTTFKVYLPCAYASPEKAQPVADGARQPVRRGGRIMIVDDEQFILDISAEMLEMLGYTSAGFQNANDALAYYREHHAEIDLVIIDMIMPQINGRECFAQMRSINPSIRAVLSTGLNISHEKDQISNDGFAGIIQKPFVMSSLAQAVLKALK